MGHPVSSDNGLISQKLFLKSRLYYYCMSPLVLPIYVWNMEFLSQPNLMLNEFVYNTVGAYDLENHVFNKFSSGGRVS